MWSTAFSPDGKRIVTASEDKTERLWDAETGKAPEIFASIQEFVAQAKAEAPRCLTQAQRKKFFLPPGLPHWCIEMEKWPYQTKAWKDWLADTNAGNYPKLPNE